jgi:predicted lipoprotein with Yx(FWY)xxD motif
MNSALASSAAQLGVGIPVAAVADAMFAAASGFAVTVFATGTVEGLVEGIFAALVGAVLDFSAAVSAATCACALEWAPIASRQVITTSVEKFAALWVVFMIPSVFLCCVFILVQIILIAVAQ